MHHRHSFMMVFVSLIVLLAATAPANSVAPPKGDPPPPDIEEFLLEDGRVDLMALWASGYTGSVNFDGYRVAMSGWQSALSPTAEKAPGDEHWIRRFPAPFPDGIFRVAVMWNGSLIAAAGRELYRWDATHWTHLPAGINGSVYALAVYGGDLIVGGHFTLAGGVAVNRIARFDGHHWHALGFGTNASVEALSSYGNLLIAGGDFSVAGQGYANRIAAWNGSTWSPLGDGLNEYVHDLIEFDGQLIAAGRFTSAGPVIVNHIAAWNGSTWSALANGTNSTVNTLAVHDGLLIAGGYFDHAGAVFTGSVAVWNGAAWSALGGVISEIMDLEVVDNQLYAGLYSYGPWGGNAQVLRWDDPEWTQLMPVVTSEYSYIYQLLDFNGQLMAAISNYNGPSAYYWNEQEWIAMTGPGFDGDITVITQYGDDLIFAGNFTQAGNVQANRIAGWNGEEWYSLGEGIPIDNSSISTMTVHGDYLIVGGRFSEIGGVPAMNIARWNGATWSALGDGLGDAETYSPVRALVSSGNLLYAGGRFFNSGALSMQHLAAWDGASWSNMQAGSSARINALAMFGDDLIVGGYDIYINYNYHYIAGLGQSGWFPLGAGVNSYVYSLAVYDGALITGGDFTQAGGQPTARLAAWDGSSWSAIASAWSPSYPEINSIAVYGNRLWVGGRFSSVDGIFARNVVSWDGMSWSNLGSGTGGGQYDDGQVRSLAAWGDVLAVGGRFTQAGGQPSCRLALYSISLTPVSDGTIPRPVVHLEQNYPNPFNPRTTLWMDLHQSGHITMAVHDLRGRLVRTLLSGQISEGRHPVVWDGLDDRGAQVSSGVYLVRLVTSDGAQRAVKVTLSK